MYRNFPTIFTSLLIHVAVSMASFGQAVKVPDAELVVSKCWSYSTQVAATRLQVSENGIFIGGEGARVDALLPDGSRLWSTELGGSIVSNIISTETGVLLVTTFGEASKAESVLRGLSKETGITNLTLAVPASEQYFLTRENGLIILISRGGIVMAVDKSGGVKWKREVAEGFAGEPFIIPGKAIIATTAKQIFAINLANGEIESMRRSATDITAVAQTISGEVIAGDDRGSISVMNGTEKPLWRFKSGGAISRVFVNGTQIVAASHDNFVYLLQTRNGDVEWKKRLGGRVQQMSLLDGRYVITASYDENAAIITDLITGKVAGQIPFADGETITAQPLFSSGSLTILTDQAVHQFSLTACAGKKESGQASKPKTASQK